jgi:DNA polymerase epsilon subunit 3
MADAAPAAATASSSAAADTDLPKAVIKRIIKSKLDALGEGNIQLHKDATLALAESAKVLINFLTATSNDICKEKKRQTINADDVLQALEEVDFGDLVAPLQVALDGARERPLAVQWQATASAPA